MKAKFDPLISSNDKASFQNRNFDHKVEIVDVKMDNKNRVESWKIKGYGKGYRWVYPHQIKIE